MKYLVGYTPDQRGQAALNLAGFLASGTDAELDVLIVAPEQSPISAAQPGEADYRDVIQEQLNTWRSQAEASVPEQVHGEVHIRQARSAANGLLDQAEQQHSSLVLVGSTASGLREKFTLGSTATALLHSSPVPVALAPVQCAQPGQQAQLSRITVFVGAKPGARSLVKTAVSAAKRRNVPLRFVSLLALDSKTVSSQELERTRKQTSEILHSMVDTQDVPTEVVSAEGATVAEAVANVQWGSGEIALLGSSRLASAGKLFMGPMTHRIMRELPVPLIVVPRDYREN